MNEVIEDVKRAIKNWWLSLILGILSIGVGVWMLFTPDSSLIALTYLFVTLFLAGGIFEIIFALSNTKIRGWGWSLAGGIFDLIFGLILLILPRPIVSIMLIYVVGFWILFRAISSIGMSIELQRMGVRGWGWELAFGILSVLFSFLFLISPAFGGLFVIAFASVAFITYGIFRIYISFEIKRLHKYIK